MRGCRSLDEVEGGMMEDQRYLFSSKKRKLRDVVLFGDAVKKTSSDDAADASTWRKVLLWGYGRDTVFRRLAIGLRESLGWRGEMLTPVGGTLCVQTCSMTCRSRTTC
jgi:hypothetical protein